MSELDATLDYAREYGMTDRDLVDLVRGEAERRRFEPPSPGLVTMVHPDLAQPILVDPEAVPVHEASGWTVQPDDEPEDDDGLPKGNASLEDWASYAGTHGLTADEIEPMSRDEIRDHFNEQPAEDSEAADTEETSA